MAQCTVAKFCIFCNLSTVTSLVVSVTVTHSHSMYVCLSVYVDILLETAGKLVLS